MADARCLGDVSVQGGLRGTGRVPWKDPEPPASEAQSTGYEGHCANSGGSQEQAVTARPQNAKVPPGPGRGLIWNPAPIATGRFPVCLQRLPPGLVPELLCSWGLRTRPCRFPPFLITHTSKLGTKMNFFFTLKGSESWWGVSLREEPG